MTLIKHVGFVAMVALAGCAMDVGDGEDPALDEAEQQLAIVGWAMPFEAATATGVTPLPPAHTDVVDGLLGWQGSWISIPLVGSFQTTAFKTSTLNGSQTGQANLGWGDVRLPADGTYRLSTTDAAIRVRGYTEVKGKGNMFTGIDAKSDAYLYVFMTVGNTIVWQGGGLLGQDSTRSESRTKSFDKSYHLPDGFMFTGAAGQPVTLLVRLESHVWSNTDGAAELGITQFGIPAVSANNLVWVQQ